MKDLLLFVLNQIPKYFSNFISVLVRPKRFVRQRNDTSEKTLAEAMIFYGVSFVITMILTWPLMPDHVESARFLAPRALANLIIVAVGSALTLISWTFVGGQARFESYFVINCYYVGVSIIFLMLVFLCAIGIVKIFDPALYPLLSQTSAHVIFQNEKLQQLINDPGNRMHWAMLVIYTVILLVGVIAVTLWSIIGWGAFREINGLSKMQSFIAGMIAFSIGSILIPISLLLLFVLD